MQETFENPETPESKPSLSPLTLAIAAVVVFAAALSLWFLFTPFQSQKSASNGGAPPSTAMTAAETELAAKLGINNIEMTRAENFLHQEVTTLAAELYNGGPQPVSAVSLTTEFFDDMNQIVLRETRNVLAPASPPLAPGEHRPFEVSFEHVPPSWNMRTPVVRVSHLELAPAKY